MSDTNNNRFIVVKPEYAGIDLSGFDPSKTPIFIAHSRDGDPFLQISPSPRRDEQTVKDVLEALNDPKIPFAIVRPRFDITVEKDPGDLMQVIDEDGEVVATIAHVGVLNDRGRFMIEALCEERARAHGITLPANCV